MYSYEQTHTSPLRSKHFNYGLNTVDNIDSKCMFLLFITFRFTFILQIQTRMLTKLSLHQTQKDDCHHTPPHGGT